MVEEITVENGKISISQRLVTLTLNRVILHTVVHHSSTSTYIPNSIESIVWTDRHVSSLKSSDTNWDKYQKSGPNKFIYCALV